MSDMLLNATFRLGLPPETGIPKRRSGTLFIHRAIFASTYGNGAERRRTQRRSEASKQYREGNGTGEVAR